MIKTLLVLLAVSSSAFAMTAQDAIKAQQGCYEVEFKFAETFAIKKGYEMKAPYKSGGLEWVEVDKDEKNEIHLQHILVLHTGSALKHWRQEWTYEAGSLFEFKGDKVWEKRNMSRADVAGEWTQRVYQVDDSPRYECSAPWVNWKNNNYWECTSWNPLPRREFSTRNDYNVLDRRNRHMLTSYGWVHEQDNRKVVARNGVEMEALTKEKGENTYKKVPDERCDLARNWWAANKQTWWAIQASWRRVYQERNRLQFLPKGNRPILWQALFGLADRAQKGTWSADKTEAEAYTIINSYLK